MLKKNKFIALLLTILLLVSLLSACGQKTPVPTLAASLATATPTPKALPAPWHKFPEQGYKNPTLAGPNGDLLKTLAENSTRYSSVQISFHTSGSSEVTATVLSPGNDVVWFDIHLVYSPINEPGATIEHFDSIYLNNQCYVKEKTDSWQTTNQDDCEFWQSIVLELHPLLNVLVGPPDSPFQDPSTAQKIDITLLPDETLDGKQVGVLSLKAPQPSDDVKVWYDKNSLLLLKFTVQSAARGVEFVFSHYDDPTLKITAPTSVTPGTRSILIDPYFKLLSRYLQPNGGL